MLEKIDPLQSVLASLRCFQDGLEQMQAELTKNGNGDVISDTARLILEMKGRLILSGVGKSGHIARKLAATFSSTGTPAYFVHPAEASHGDLGVIQDNDVVLLMSWSGETRELSDVVAYCARFDVPMISITGNSESTLARKTQYPIILPRAEEACPHNLAPTTSTLLQLAMGDALAVTLLRMRGFSEESFRNFHPGGKLGSVLQPISEFMFKGDQLPLVEMDAPIIEVISEISNKGFGIVGMRDVNGNLVGVITDGDIRRYLESNASGTMKSVIWKATAASLMTPGGVRLEPERLSARALNILQKNKISAAFVVEDSKPVGLVTVLQLLQRGVA